MHADVWKTRRSRGSLAGPTFLASASVVQIKDDSDVELQEIASTHQPHGSRLPAVEDIWANTHDCRAE